MKKKIMIHSLCIATFLFSSQVALVVAQNVGINTSGAVPNTSALFDVDDGTNNNVGMLIPRIALTDVSVYAPITGSSTASLVVYNTNATLTNGNGEGYYYWSGTKWLSIPAPTNGPGTAGQVLASQGTGTPPQWSTLSSGVPSGAVMFFDLAVCPTGWTELAAGQGRYIVGLPAGGTLNAFVGTALSNIENRDVGQHSHSTVVSSDGTHTHTITDPGHFHSTVIRHMGNGVFTNENYANASGGSDETRISDTKTTGITINSSAAHSHTVSINSAGTTSGTNAPYIQLRVCKKD